MIFGSTNNGTGNATNGLIYSSQAHVSCHAGILSYALIQFGKIVFAKQQLGL